MNGSSRESNADCVSTYFCNTDGSIPALAISMFGPKNNDAAIKGVKTTCLLMCWMCFHGLNPSVERQ